MLEFKKCWKCKQTKPRTDFYRNKNRKDGLNDKCKKCSAANSQLLYHPHPQPKPPRPTCPLLYCEIYFKQCLKCRVTKPTSLFRIKKHQTAHQSSKYNRHCKNCQDSIEKERYAKNSKTICAQAKSRRRNNQDSERERERQRNWQLKLELIDNYGGQCACCHEREPCFLTIDHVFNDGHIERRESGKMGKSMYKYLRSLGYPKDRYQLLCYNCNMSKGRYGQCPHEAKRRENELRRAS
jgi:hypothetical protein